MADIKTLIEAERENITFGEIGEILRSLGDDKERCEYIAAGIAYGMNKRTGEAQAAEYEGEASEVIDETRATFIVDKAKLKALKVYAAKNDLMIKEVLDQAITEYLKNH